MSWLQINFSIEPALAEIYEAALLAAGALSITYEDQAHQPILEPDLGETPLWNATKITALFEATVNTKAASLIFFTHLSQQIPQADLPTPKWEILEDKDWQREWMDSYHPIDCGEHLWICPSWIVPPVPEATNVLLDPGLAFGTGTHPTTLLCLQWLARQDINGSEVVDYGCGSGILAIAALLRGASKAIGIDIDPQALIATRDNTQRNNIAAAKMATYLPQNIIHNGKLKPDTTVQPAPLVMANILAGPLIELAPLLTELTQPGGKLCLSGILSSQADAVQAAYAEDFVFDPIRTTAEWAQLSAVRKH